MPAAPLTTEQLEDAARLKKIFLGWQGKQRDAGRPYSQEAVSGALGFNQSALNQYLNGRIPLNAGAATKFAGLLGVPVGQFSPTLEKQLRGYMLAAYQEDPRVTQDIQEEADRRASIIVFDPEDGIPDGMVLVPEYRVSFSAGNGHIHYEPVNEDEPAAYRRTWFQKMGIKPERTRRFRVTGDSQEPFLFHGDTVLVNLDETNVVDGKLYAIRYDNDLRIKFLFRKLDGTLILRSKNPAYPDEEVSGELANEHISIIGRVRDMSGSGGL